MRVYCSNLAVQNVIEESDVVVVDIFVDSIVQVVRPFDDHVLQPESLLEVNLEIVRHLPFLLLSHITIEPYHNC